MTDLGNNLITIDQWLKLDTLSNETVESVGERLGRVLATLHAEIMNPRLLAEFENKGIADMLKKEVVVPTIKNLESLTDAGEVQKIMRVLMEELDSLPKNTVFSIGDLWTGSIILDISGQSLAIVDWEFAGAGRALQDVVQLGKVT